MHSYDHPGNNSILTNINFSDPSHPLHAPGLCPATGITADSNFYRSEWPIPGKVSGGLLAYVVLGQTTLLAINILIQPTVPCQIFEYATFLPLPAGASAPTADQVPDGWFEDIPLT